MQNNPESLRSYLIQEGKVREMVNMPKESLKNKGIGREMNKVEKSMMEMEITG